MIESIIGISAYYHDSAAAILINGEIVAAAQEERFTRVKHDASFPVNAIKYVFEEGCIDIKDIKAVTFYDKPLIKFERLLETYHSVIPRGLISFINVIPIWIKEKLFLKRVIRKELKKLGIKEVPILFSEHHLSHAASAFYPSPFEEAAILTVDGVGEWATTTICHGFGNKIKILKELSFPHSIGLLYSAFTYYCGFRVNSGEYKLMGLTPYGNPESPQTKAFTTKIEYKLIDIRDDGSLFLNMDYFSYTYKFKMVNEKKWTELFGISPRVPESEITQDYMNLAYSIQIVTEKIIIRLSETAKLITGSENLVMAGGVALNSVANGKILNKKIFKNIWIQPAAGDAGGALGSALATWHIWKGEKRKISGPEDFMKGAYLGPEYSENEIKTYLKKSKAKYIHYNSFDEMIDVVTDEICQGKVIGWFQGRMEYGPRALGNRSIIADPRNDEMQKRMNLKIKFRESFRPFAPSVLEEDIKNYFDIACPSPYMLFVIPVKKTIRTKGCMDIYNGDLHKRLYQSRSIFPAITHVDYSARIQSVNKEINQKYWMLINKYKDKTGHGVIINTSFNVRGEPIVCTPNDAYRCFMNTDIDLLIIGNFLIKKTK
jgi:carbamoyltransferase